jgi:hypothetical protein
MRRRAGPRLGANCKQNGRRRDVVLGVEAAAAAARIENRCGGSRKRSTRRCRTCRRRKKSPNTPRRHMADQECDPSVSRPPPWHELQQANWNIAASTA